MDDMTTRTRILLLGILALLPFAGFGAAHAESTPVSITLRPVADVSFPFWCDWSYDWEARCWWEDGDRLPVGGDSDKVWRAGLRFSLSSVPAGSTILDASLTLRHDAVCLAPGRTTRPCQARSYTIDLHPIFTASWFSEREVEIGPLLSRAVLPWATQPAWLSWDLTGLVESWLAGEPNHGVLLKLADAQENYDVGGPAFPSSSFASAESRPALDLVYLPPGG
jgi:hypothetical protein